MPNECLPFLLGASQGNVRRFSVWKSWARIERSVRHLRGYFLETIGTTDQPAFVTFGTGHAFSQKAII